MNISAEEWNAIDAFRSTPTEVDTEARDDKADSPELVDEVAVSEESTEVADDERGAGLTTVAASRRISLLANRARS
jgi:hypothetical protein